MEQNQKSQSGIFSRMKGFLGGKKMKISEGEKRSKEKETLKEYKDVLTNEANNKNYQSLENDKGDIVEKKENTLREKLEEKKEKFKQSWKAPTILKTNLAKGEQTLYIDWGKNFQKLIFMSALSCFFVAIVYVGLIVWGINTKSEGKILDSNIGHLEAQIATLADDVKEIDIFYGKLKNADALLDRHIYWNNVFEFVEKNTLANVQIVNGISGKPESKYTFSVVTDNFTTLNQQVIHLKKQDEVIDAQIDGGDFAINSKDPDNPVVILNSNISLTLKPEIFFDE